MTNGRAETDAEFAEYVGAHADQVRFTAFLLCGDWHEAEDLAQTAFVRLYVAWERIDRSEPINSYVRRTVTRAYLNRRRGLWRRLERLTSTPPDPASPAPPPDPERRMLVMAALAQVPRRQRAALVLRYWEDLSLAETADILGCSIGNVKSQCARGLQRLRKLLPDDLVRGVRGR